MEIFFAVNEAYTRQLCVAILSIAENNRNSPLNFHILSSNFPETSRHAVQKICTFYPNTTITFHTPDMKRFADLKLNIAHISIETYFRYIIAEMMPSLDKCLYLDADIVVNGSLRPLWEMDLQDNYCIGIKDSSGNFDNTLKYIENTDPRLHILAGSDSLILWTLKAGGSGAISGCSNVFPELMVSIYELFKKGDFEAANEAQKKIRPFRNVMQMGNPNSVVKRAAQLLGYEVGPARAPSNVQNEAIDKALLDVFKLYKLGFFACIRPVRHAATSVMQKGNAASR